jgi:hypothetical protein
MDHRSVLDDSPRPEPKKYPLPDGGSIDAADLSSAERETQIGAMREWFLQNFEDPAKNTPYDSGEGGYQFIWGGPYAPLDELKTEFSGLVADDVIEELANTLSTIAVGWSGIANHSNSSDLFDQYLSNAAPDPLMASDRFRDNIRSISRLLEMEVEWTTDYQCFLRLLYVNVVTALECYLSDKFISSIKADRDLFRKFVETTPEFQKEKVSLSSIFKASEEIEQKVMTHLSEFVWHRFDRVAPMFRDTLGVEFPTDMKELHRAIVIRHVFVHRNGQRKDGAEYRLYQEDIEKLIVNAQRLVKHIEPNSRL